MYNYEKYGALDEKYVKFINDNLASIVGDDFKAAYPGVNILNCHNH